MTDKAVVVACFEGERDYVEAFLVDMPKDGLDEFELFLGRILGGPASQAKGPTSRLNAPEKRPAKSVGGMERFEAEGLAIVRKELQNPLDFEFDSHRWVSRGKSEKRAPPF